MKLTSIATPPGWDGSPLQVIPQHFVAGTHLYSWVERGTARATTSPQKQFKFVVSDIVVNSKKNPVSPNSKPQFLIFCYMQAENLVVYQDNNYYLLVDVHVFLRSCLTVH